MTITRLADMSLSNALLLTDDTVALPIIFPNQGGKNAELRVTLHSDKKLFAIWDFSVAFQSKTVYIVLSLSRLDRFSLILQNPLNQCPLAKYFRMVELPGPSDMLFLSFEITANYERTLVEYSLKWPTSEAFKNCLRSWSESNIPPINWFYVEITNCCNLSCSFCPSRTLKRPRQHMDVELARQIFEQISQYQEKTPYYLGNSRVEHMVFLHIMGEPLIHPEFDKILSIAKENKLTLGIFTNATILDKKHINAIMDNDLSFISLSLNVTTKEACNEHGNAGINEQEQNVIELIRERINRKATNLHIDIQYMRTSHQRGTLDDGLITSNEQAWSLYSRWLQIIRHLEKDIDFINTSYWGVDLDASLNPLLSHSNGEPILRLPLSQDIDLVLKDCCSFGNAIVGDNSLVVPTSRGKCPFGNPNRILCIFADGHTSFCSFDYENSIDLGNVAEEPIWSIWKSKRLQEIRSEMDKGHLTEPLCQKCMGNVVAAYKGDTI